MKQKLSISCALLAAVLFIISCSKEDAVADTSDTTTTTSGTASISDAVADVASVTSCSSASGIEQIICLADALKAQLSSTQIAALQLDYTISNAERWSNLPQALVASQYKRVGLNLGALTTAQLKYVVALLKAVAGTTTNEGYDELVQLMYADDYLKDNGGGSSYGYANYYLAFLGEPSATGTFEVQFGGHHTAFANTYKSGVLAGATPSFRGVEPFATFTEHNKTCQPIQQEQAALSAMLTGLTSTQLTTAKLSGTYSDLVLGPQQDGKFLTTYSGISCSNLTTAQKTLVLNAIATYVGDIADSSAIMTRYSNELNSSYISYSGTTGVNTRNDYVRIDGPSVWIEYSVQNGIVLQPTHPHSVWRDKSTDYGGNL